MSSAALIDEMQGWADKLVREAQTRPSPAGYLKAMHRVAKRERISYATLKGLKYKPPKRFDPLDVVRLCEAYRAYVERQAKHFDAELERTSEIAGSNSLLVRTAAAIAGASVREKEAE
jgi:hypothetical protein